MSRATRCIKGFGERLEKTIYSNNSSISQLAEHLNCSWVTVWNYINDNYLPNSYYLAKICKFYNVSADYLLFGKEE